MVIFAGVPGLLIDNYTVYSDNSIITRRAFGEKSDMSMNRDKLREYQKKAVKNIEMYIKSREDSKSSLVQIPTGTGKSGVMAFSLNLFRAKGFLIVVPNAALPYQMKEEINSGFWEKIGESDEDKRQAEIISGKTVFSKNKVYITTIQQLTEIKKNSGERFEALKNCIDVLFYDEGHHEPANEWSKVSRNFPCKKVLFTATPYRNDYQGLDISKKYMYSYTLKDALEENVIVSPAFYGMPDEIINSPKGIAAFIGENSEGHRALVRIIGAERIKTIGAAFSEGKRVACCHSNLPTDRGRHYYRTGLRMLNEADNYDVIVQTDMISEGIDIPGLDQLYYIDGYNNSKSMFQIIGRVLRKCEGKEKADVFVPESKLAEIKEQWEICASGEEQTYINGQFVTRTNIFESVDIIPKLNFEKQARVFYSDHSVYDEFIQSINERLDKASTIIVSVKSGEAVVESNKLYAVCYEHQMPSRYLRDGYYLNSSIDYISLLEIIKGKTVYYFYHSTQRLSFDCSPVKEIPPSELYKLIGSDSQLLHVSFQSAMNSSMGVKSYGYKGIRLDSLASNRQQRMSLFHNALAANRKKLRYISEKGSKVTDRKESGNAEEYVEWCEDLAEKFMTGSAYSYFDRFAVAVNRPSGEQIDYVLIRDTDIESATDPKRKAYLYDLFEVDRDQFSIKIDGIEVECSIEESGGKRLIKINADEGEEYMVYHSGNDDPIINTIKHDFILYFCESNTLYSEGFYYRPNIGLPYSDPFQFELRNRIEAVSGMERCVNEKTGTHPGGDFGTSFPPDSVFGVVQRYLMRNTNDFDYILCEDMGIETADLIAVNSVRQRICLIHCKYGKSMLGARAFHEVCGQAIKNITEFIVTNSRQVTYLDSLLEKWKENTWRCNGKYTAQRFLKGDYASFRDVFKSIIGSATARKEVWIATSGLSIGKLDRELTSQAPNRELLPLLHLLHSTEDVFSGIGVNFKILCKE